MTAALPSLALALLCLLQVGAQVPVQPDLDTKKFAGVWYVTAIASNCSIFLKMKDGMKSPMAIISFMPEGDLTMKLVWPLMDKCQKFELLFQQSGQAGHYMGAQEKRNLRVMETDYSHYAVLHEVQHSEAEPSTALQLLSALGVGTWLLGRGGVTSSRQGLGFPPLPRATTSSTPHPSPRELILG
uniref:extracellular fatty acid-binding protein isoform X2 n=1 Tax=Lonchura striata TaxID=40157 RepID=UPI0012934EBE|nr:extracellular fatty acid-binding protein isoform X2 [Lonchura striata domestica]